MDIQKLILDNKGLLLEKSQLNYGVMGLHSIVISQTNNRFTHLMITDETHEMWYNHFGLLGEINAPITMPIQGGKNNLKLVPLFGCLWLHLFKKTRKKENRIYPPEEQLYFKHIWKNPTDFPNVCGYELKGQEVLTYNYGKLLNVNDDFPLKNTDLFSLYVEKNNVAAWLMVEMQGEGLYDRLTYSNADLTQWDCKNFYQKATPQTITDLLNKIDLKL